jgi:hypothetical protein
MQTFLPHMATNILKQIISEIFVWMTLNETETKTVMCVHFFSTRSKSRFTFACVAFTKVRIIDFGLHLVRITTANPVRVPLDS